MSKDKYVEQTLTLPSELPLFNYNISFEGLRHILQGVNLQTNAHQELITKLQQQMNKKLPTPQFQLLQKKLNNSFLFGTRCQNYLDKAEEKSYKVHKTQVKDLPDTQQFCWKINKMAEIVEYLMDKCEKHQEKINNDNQRHQQIIDQSFRRLQDKLSSGLDSFSKTINTYFTQTNDKVSALQSEVTLFKKTTESKFEDVTQNLGKKVSDGNLKATLQGWENKIKKQLQSMLKNDHMQRLGTVNQVKQSFKEAQKDIELKNKAIAIKMQQLADKVNKAMQINTFEIQKHKIYEKLSELKNRSDELVRKNGQFVEFRKNYLTNNQKIKQEIIGISDEINKMQNKESNFKKLQNMSDVLNSLNPHLICEIGQEVKLHGVEIGKLQKMILTMDAKIQNSGGLDKTMPQVTGSQNSDLIQKIIKEYMSNLDFQGRVKRTEKDIYELKKKNDALNELQKKIYALSKELDVGAIMKELKRKCDEQNTRKDTRILDGKIQQLFDFYKQLRREIEEKKKIVNKSEPFESATLTTKRLLSANCISCTPNTNTPANRRHLAKSRLEMSLDYSLEGQRHTLYTRGK